MAKAKHDEVSLLFDGKNDAVRASYERLAEKLRSQGGAFWR